MVIEARCVRTDESGHIGREFCCRAENCVVEHLVFGFQLVKIIASLQLSGCFWKAMGVRQASFS